MRFNFVLVSCFLLVPAVLPYYHCITGDAINPWAGGIVWPDDGTAPFTYVKGTFTAPQLWGDPGSALAQWVSIDNERGCDGVTLTSGIVSIVTSTEIQHRGFLSWHPSASLDFDIAISTGNNIQIELDLSDWSTGSLVFKNLDSGQNVTKTFQSSSSLCGSFAGWMVGYAEELSGGYLNFSPFDHLIIKDATAGVQNGPSYRPSGDGMCEVTTPYTNLTATTTHPDKPSLTFAYVSPTSSVY